MYGHSEVGQFDKGRFGRGKCLIYSVESTHGTLPITK